MMLLYLYDMESSLYGKIQGRNKRIVWNEFKFLYYAWMIQLGIFEWKK